MLLILNTFPTFKCIVETKVSISFTGPKLFFVNGGNKN